MRESVAESQELSHDERPQRSSAPSGNPNRLGNPTRIVPRRTSPPEPPPVGGVDAAPVTTATGHEDDASLTRDRAPDSLFAPHSFQEGRIKVWGFSPGWLLILLVASVMLTILLNMMF